jgi:hypothetical protein
VNYNDPKCEWGKTSIECIEMYKLKLDTLLSDKNKYQDGLNCIDCMCKEHICRDNIDNLYLHIVNSCVEAGKHTIPQSKRTPIKSRSKPIPGWNEYVEPVRQKSLMWHEIWKGQGSPKEGVVAQIMRKTRLEYHLIVKQVKRDENRIVNEKLAGLVIDRDSRNLWKELKNIKGTGKCVPGTIDGISGDKNIANLFVIILRFI